MKSLEEIKECKRLIVGRVSHDGGSGVVNIGGWEGSVVWSYGGGWDHVSVSPRQKRIIPSWDDMCRLKDIFFHIYGSSFVLLREVPPAKLLMT